MTYSDTSMAVTAQTDNILSADSYLYWGLLHKDRFIGRAITIFWPLSRMKKLKLEQHETKIAQ